MIWFCCYCHHGEDRTYSRAHECGGVFQFGCTCKHTSTWCYGKYMFFALVTSTHLACYATLCGVGCNNSTAIALQVYQAARDEASAHRNRAPCYHSLKIEVVKICKASLDKDPCHHMSPIAWTKQLYVKALSGSQNGLVIFLKWRRCWYREAVVRWPMIPCPAMLIE